MTTEDAARSPGNPNWVRNLLETLVAQREPLAEGSDRVGKLVANFWTGDSARRFGDRVGEDAAAWRAVLEIHDGVVRRADGHNSFVHQLPHLWNPADPPERRRYESLWRGAAGDVREMLLRAAAALDAIAPDQDVWREQVVTPYAEVAASSIELVPEWPAHDPDPPYQHRSAPGTSVNSVVFEYRRRLVEQERLFEQLLVAPRVTRVHWHR
ncbi:hypothetical protein JOD54_001048 [Actinokineospora baliensis]|uniref:hypothetical protein n=1 Tax=Actinokineospora baliensis TaxID=547056 RepID=UPI001959E6AB|nr:hypothetical protein [Actinokineospora baliensis]MBM7770844.1 hypothetical protein [Actinokineospora baliensis]